MHFPKKENNDNNNKNNNIFAILQCTGIGLHFYQSLKVNGYTYLFALSTNRTAL